MLDNGLTAVEGSVWFVGPVVASAKFLTLDSFDDDELFQLVVTKLGLGSAPAVLYDPRDEHQLIRFYPSGLAEEDEVERLALFTGSVTLDEVFAVMDRLYETKLCTPEAQSTPGSTWQSGKAANHWAADNAESVVQMYLDTALWTAFAHCKVECEYTQTSGRLDISLIGLHPAEANTFIHHVVIELKVLRAFSSNGRPKAESYNRKWVEKGLDQAWSYAKEHGAQKAALCCYDMRKEYSGEACFAHVRQRAQELGVALKCWHLFGTSEDYRVHQRKMAQAATA